MKAVAIIPARFASTRLPGKPLKDICGKPMIWWVYQQVIKVNGLDRVIIATDNSDIFSVCRNYGMEVMMTKEGHPTAIHRLYEISKVIDADFYIQINGDEPLIKPEMIELLLDEGTDIKGLCGKNIITPINNPVEAMDISNIKMVFDKEHICTYMSRIPIPYPYSSISYTYYKHVGVIGYTKKMLNFFVTSIPGRLERIEGIDLLRFIDYRKKLYLIEVKECNTLSIDTEKDLDEIRKRTKNMLI